MYTEIPRMTDSNINEDYRFYKYPMNKILVLLSAYNGEKFIEEQIKSLLKQENVDIHILIRDDGSTDNTCKIIEKYLHDTQRVTLMKGDNIGCVGSFCAVAKEAYDNYSDYDYYAFCDQDDIWMKDKCERACTVLNKYLDCQYLLYASAYQMVDEQLESIPTIMLPSNKTFGESLIIQPTIGCTMVFNFNLLRLFVKGRPDGMLMHDSWMYKMCLGCGGTYLYDDKPTILYRQHGHNVKGGDQTFSQLWKQRLGNFLHNRRSRSIQAMNLLETYKDDLTKENKKLLSDFVACRHSFCKRLKVACSSRYKTVKLSHEMLFRAAVILNKV